MAQSRKKSAGSKRKHHASGAPQESAQVRAEKTRNALRGLFLGVVIFLVLVLLFLVPFNGKTLFSHFLSLFPDEPEVVETKQESQAATKSAAPVAPAPKVDQNAANAAPLEELTPSDEAALDKLIDNASK